MVSSRLTALLILLKLRWRESFCPGLEPRISLQSGLPWIPLGHFLPRSCHLPVQSGKRAPKCSTWRIGKTPVALPVWSISLKALCLSLCEVPNLRATLISAQQFRSLLPFVLALEHTILLTLTWELLNPQVSRS